MAHVINLNSDDVLFFKEINSKTLKSIKMMLAVSSLDHPMLLIKPILKSKRTCISDN